MKKLVEKANILMESLPYIRNFYGKTFVIKYGGSAMEKESLKESFSKDIVLMKYIGLNPVIVHGGGPQIGEMLKKIGKKSVFLEGMRVTDDETMDIVEMVLVGKVNKQIVSLINRHGGKAVGLSGKDGGLIKARKIRDSLKKSKENPSELIDLGKVGEVTEINSSVIESLDANNFIPVIAPVGVSDEGATYNINADLVASAVAKELKAEKLILLTDVEGVLDHSGKLISTILSKDIESMIKKGVISGGMIPKVACCKEALNGGVKKAHVIDGRIEHAVLLEIFTSGGVGTEIVEM